MVEDVAFEVGCYWGVFLAGFGARGGRGCGARVEDVHCGLGMLGNVVGFHVVCRIGIVTIVIVKVIGRLGE